PRRPPWPTLFPYTTLFRSEDLRPDADERLLHRTARRGVVEDARAQPGNRVGSRQRLAVHLPVLREGQRIEAHEHARRHLLRHLRSEEHTSELQSRENLVCR